MSLVHPSTRAPVTDGVAIGPVPAGHAGSAEAARAERRAWVVLWVAFATFSVLLVSTVKLTSEYVNGAVVDLTARVEAAPKLTGIRPLGSAETLVVQGERDLSEGTLIEVARGGSLRLRLFDQSLVAVSSAASLELAQMDVGRFIPRKEVVLNQQDGAVQYQPTGEARINVPNGQVVLNGGDHTVWVQGDRTTILSYAGEARVETDGGSSTVRAGQKVEIGPDRRLSDVTERGTELLMNGNFARRYQDWQEYDVNNGGTRDRPGERRLVRDPSPLGGILDALQVVRESVAQTHGETGLRQPLSVDVSGYRRLQVEALVRVDRASLSGGGNLGFEYPMMLRLAYEGVPVDSRPDWVQGFYYANPDQQPVRNATTVPRGEWVQYRSPNLLDQEEGRRPVRLLSFEVMGQGHTYDARVAAVRLVAD